MTEKWRCAICGTSWNLQRCYGCDAFICRSCDRAPLDAIWNKEHAPEDHAEFTTCPICKSSFQKSKKLYCSDRCKAAARRLQDRERKRRAKLEARA